MWSKFEWESSEKDRRWDITVLKYSTSLPRPGKWLKEENEWEEEVFGQVNELLRTLIETLKEAFFLPFVDELFLFGWFEVRF